MVLHYREDAESGGSDGAGAAYRDSAHSHYPHEAEAPGGAGAGASSVDPIALGCMPITRLSLRAAESILTLISFSVLAAAQGPSGGQVLSSSPIVFLLAIGVLGFVYSLATLALLTLALLRPESDLSYRLPRPLLLLDFIFLLLLFGSSSAAAGIETAVCVQTDYYMPSQQMWSACSMVSAGAAMGFLASFAFMADFWLTLIPVFTEI